MSKIFIFHILELVAALAGSYHYLKTKNFIIRPFIWYLWLVVFVETFGMYGYILQYNYDNELFIWIKNSVFCYNRWLYNIFHVLAVILFGIYYKRVLKDNKAKQIVTTLVAIYVIFSVGYALFSNDFFMKSIPYNHFLETFIVFIFVMLFYREILKSDRILVFYKEPAFYISSGLLLWYLGVTPLFIFDGYFYAVNPNFIEFRSFYLLIANILLYSCYTIGFLYTIQFKKG